MWVGQDSDQVEQQLRIFVLTLVKKQKEADLGLAGGQEDIEYCRGMNENDVDDDDYYEVKTLMMMSSVRSEGAWCDWQQGGLATIC